MKHHIPYFDLFLLILVAAMGVAVLVGYLAATH